MPFVRVPVKSPDSLGNHLNALLLEADNRIQELSGVEDSPQVPFSTRASFSSIIGELHIHIHTNILYVITNAFCCVLCVHACIFYTKIRATTVISTKKNRLAF